MVTNVTYKVFINSKDGGLIDPVGIMGSKVPNLILQVGETYKIKPNSIMHQPSHNVGFTSYETASSALECYLNRNINYDISICEVTAIGDNLELNTSSVIVTPELKINRIIPKGEYSSVLTQHEFIYNFRRDQNSICIKYIKTPDKVANSYLIYNNKVTRKVEVGANLNKSHNYDFYVDKNNVVEEVRLHGVPIFDKNRYIHHKRAFFSFIDGSYVIRKAIVDKSHTSDYVNGLFQCFGAVTSTDETGYFPLTSINGIILYSFTYGNDKDVIIGANKVTGEVVSESHRYCNEDGDIVKIDYFYTSKNGIKYHDNYIITYNEDRFIKKVVKNNLNMLHNNYDEHGQLIESKLYMDKYINNIKYSYDTELDIRVDCITFNDGGVRYTVRNTKNNEYNVIMTYANDIYKYFNDEGEGISPYLVVDVNANDVDEDITKSYILAADSFKLNVTHLCK